MKKLLFLLLIFPAMSMAQSAVEKGRKLYEEKKHAEAKKILTTVEDGNKKDYAAAQYLLGRIAFDEKKYDDASDFFEEAVDNNDNVAEYHNWLGNAYGSIAKDANVIRQGTLAPKMKSQWERAIVLDPALIDARTSLIQYYLQAPGFMGGSVDKAKATAREIIKLNPARGHLELGNIYYKEKNLAEAEKEYTEMIKADPMYATGLVNFYVQQKQYDKAFSLMDDTIKKYPDQIIWSYQFGKISALSGQRLEKGEDYLKKYLAYTPKGNEPSHAGAKMRLAQIFEKKGNKTEAKKLFEEALKADPSLTEAKDGVKRTS